MGVAVGETKIAFVPSVIVTGLTQRTYGVVLTEVRALLVLQRSLSLLVLWGALGGGMVIGILLSALANLRSATDIVLAIALGMFLLALLARAGTRERTPDYAVMTPDQLANRKGTFSIPYTSIQALELEKRSRISTRLRITYVDVAGLPHQLRLLLVPQIQWVRSRTVAGVKYPEAHSEYVESVRQALLRSLPPEVASRVGFT